MKKTEARTPEVRKVSLYGNPVLRVKAKPVARIDSKIRALVDEMLAAMRAANGVGLAAQQVGETAALCVIEIPAELPPAESGVAQGDGLAMPLVMINPSLTDLTGTMTGQEGCLSFPEIFVQVKRASEVTASFQDLQGKHHTVRAKALLARAIQHEMDHLNGVLLVDRMSAIKKISLSGKLKKLKKEGADQVA
jgi:peptide deformylase